jgi:predicted RNA binding protein YcfA (HicA-like mRNA interferase family)
VRILEQFGFVVIRVRGSHHILRRVIPILDEQGNETGRQETQTINVPVHGSKPLATGMLKRLFNDTCRYIPEELLRSRFYAD